MAPNTENTTEDGLLYIRVTQQTTDGPSLHNTPTNNFEYNQIHEQYRERSGSQHSRSSCSLNSQKKQSWIKKNWGWMITFCNFVYYFIFIGFLCCFTLLFVHLQEDFHSSATETGWVGNMAWALSNLATPFANYLIFKLRSTRLVVFIGVVMCSVGLVSSSYVTNIYYLYGTMGILLGLGGNFICHSSAVLLVQYFPGNSCTRCVSLMTLGAPIGLLVLSQFMDIAFTSIGWRVTLRYGGIVFFIVCSLLCIPLVPAPPTAYQLPQDTSDDKQEEEEDTEDNMEQKETFLEKPPLPGSDDQKGFSVKNRKVSTVSMASTMMTFKSFIMLTTAWITSAAFFLSAVAQSFHNVNFVGHLYVMGLSKHSTSVLTALAIGEIVGKMNLGIVGHKIKFPKVYLLAISNITAGICTLALAWISSGPLAIGVTALLGYLRSGYQTLGTPVLVETYGITRIYDAATSMMLANGVGFLVGSLAMGMSYDYFGSYLISIILAMCLFTIAGALFLSTELRHKCTRAGRKEQAELEQEMEIAQVVGMDPSAQQIMPWPSVLQLDHTDDPEHNGSTFIVHVGDAVTVVDVEVESPTQV
ncbi:monocarboxylate transporter 12-B-like [Amphiura filiformis]|uniref:monocarboxylate transporter 12-B-like n=1 Tax=Amphiura filiformis TaxID=82378 RepID=UPI003B213795